MNKSLINDVKEIENVVGLKIEDWLAYNEIKMKIKQIEKLDRNDGLIDSLYYLMSNRNKENDHLINLLLTQYNWQI